VTAGPSPTVTRVVYTVVAGDSLFSIAEQFKANVCTMMIINNITDPSLLSVGQVLIIPGPDTQLPTPTPLPTGLPRGTTLEYVVQCGDTLDSIARAHGTSARSIAFWNRGTYPSLDPESAGYRPNTVRIGWTLMIIPHVIFDEESLPAPS